MGKKLFVGNLSYEVTLKDLQEFFSQAGQVTSARVMCEQDTGKPKGFAFVEMGSDDEARKAISVLNNQKLQGRNVSVKEAMPPKPKARPDEVATRGGPPPRKIGTPTRFKRTVAPPPPRKPEAAPTPAPAPAPEAEAPVVPAPEAGKQEEAPPA